MHEYAHGVEILKYIAVSSMNTMSHTGYKAFTGAEVGAAVVAKDRLTREERSRYEANSLSNSTHPNCIGMHDGIICFI